MGERKPARQHHGWMFSGRGAHLYNWWSGLVGRRLYRRVVADVAARAHRGATVLDVGTGTGRLLVELARRRDDLALSGADLSADMIAVARHNAERAGLADRIALRAADVAELPYPDGSFDLVISTLSMHHWPSLPRATAELGRVLRPGGDVWIYDFRFVSDAELTTAVDAEPAFAGRPVNRSSVRPGLLPIYVRLALSKPGAGGPSSPPPVTPSG